MELTVRESAMLEAFRQLPAEAAEEVSALAQRLAALGTESRANWSDEWTDADLQDYAAAALRRVDAVEDEPEG